MRSLEISPVPFKPSNLSIPPSPFSPISPLIPHSPPFPSPRKKWTLRTSTVLATPPSTPLQWMWQCHSCRSTYPLGATRRCLEDGHFFCAGSTTIVKKNGKGGKGRKRVVKVHKACASEFDYQSWKDWGEWRRGCWKRLNDDRAKGSAEERDCWNYCDYPSECRWGKQGTEVNMEGTTAVVEAYQEMDNMDNSTFDAILGISSPPRDVRPPTRLTLTPTPPPPRQPKVDFWTSLLASATGRRRKSVSSPLTSSTVVKEFKTVSSSTTDHQVDVEMEDVSAKVPIIVAPEPALQMPTSTLEYHDPLGTDVVDHTIASCRMRWACGRR